MSVTLYHRGIHYPSQLIKLLIACDMPSRKSFLWHSWVRASCVTGKAAVPCLRAVAGGITKMEQLWSWTQEKVISALCHLSTCPAEGEGLWYTSGCTVRLPCAEATAKGSSQSSFLLVTQSSAVPRLLLLVGGEARVLCDTSAQNLWQTRAHQSRVSLPCMRSLWGTSSSARLGVTQGIL